MSIFKDTFPEYVRKQLEKRQEIVGSRSLTRLGGNNVIGDKTAFLQWQNTKASWIRMFSLVEIKKPTGSPPAIEIKEEFGDEYRYNIMDSGILNSTIDPSSKLNLSQRSSFNDTYKYEYDRERGHVPMPGILDASIETKTAYGSLKEASVNFVCYSKKQFDLIEKLYMRLGHHVLIEWGWSKYIDLNFNRVIDIGNILSDELLNDRSKITQEYIENQVLKYKEKYFGCYDGFLGIVKNFNYDFDGHVYKCNIILMGKGEVLSEFKLNSNSIYSSNLYLNQEDEKDVDLSEIEAYFLFGDLPIIGITQSKKSGRFIDAFLEFINPFGSFTPPDTLLESFTPGASIIPELEQYANIEDIEQDTDQFKNFQQKIAEFINLIRQDLGIFTKEKWTKAETPFDSTTIPSLNTGYSRPWLQALNEVDKSPNSKNIETYYQWGHICDVINLYIKNTADNSNLTRLQTYDSGSDGLDYHTFEPNRIWQQFHYINNTILQAYDKTETRKIGGPYLSTTNYYYETGDISNIWDNKISVGEQLSEGTTIPRLPVVYSDNSDNVIYVENKMEHLAPDSFEDNLYSSDLKKIKPSERFFIKDIYFSRTFILNTLKNSIKNDDEKKIKIGDFIKSLWREANKAFGNINEFTLNDSDKSNYSRIIDLNHINPIKSNENKLKEIFTFESTRIGFNDNFPFKYFEGQGSILRDLKISSTIPSGLATTVAVGAQNRGSLDALESVTFAQYNKGVRDIIYDNLNKSKDPQKVEEERIKRQDRLDQNIKNKINKYLESITNTQKQVTIGYEEIPIQGSTPFIGPLLELTGIRDNIAGTTSIPIKAHYLLYYPATLNGVPSKSDVLRVISLNPSGNGLSADFEFIVRDGDRAKPFNNNLQNLIGLSNYLCKVVGFLGDRPYNENPLSQGIPPISQDTNLNIFILNPFKRRFDVDFKIIPDSKQFYRPAIPLDLNITLDGISGIVKGNLFKLDLQDLPDAYSTNGDIGFITVGESQKITPHDWTTDIKGLFHFIDYMDHKTTPVAPPVKTDNTPIPTETDEGNEQPDDTQVETTPKDYPIGTTNSYDSVKNTTLTTNFKWEEFTSNDGRGFSGGRISENEVIANIRILARQLEIIRAESGPLIVNSGFRSITYNRDQKGVENSQHPYGRAADLDPLNITPKELHRIIERLINEGKILQGGVGLYNGFVHYDIRGTRARWDFST